MAIIGFTGKRGSGKDTASKFLETMYGFRMLDFTRDVLAPILANRGLPVTRENLIDIAMDGRKKSHNGVWADKLSVIIKRNSVHDFVISGIRFPEEVGVFRRNFGEGFRLVAIVCDDRHRYERVMKRGTKGEAGLSFDGFLQIEKRPTERVIAETMGIADFVIGNNGTIQDLYDGVSGILKILKGR
ncbi:MAG: AAA family ATPase [Candidatus Aenigmarchaeota archaeon]|nr:AAA family ATPase [Candidatus Aenigmarchaeota archaeon]